MSLIVQFSPESFQHAPLCGCHSSNSEIYKLLKTIWQNDAQTACLRQARRKNSQDVGLSHMGHQIRQVSIDSRSTAAMWHIFLQIRTEMAMKIRSSTHCLKVQLSESLSSLGKRHCFNIQVTIRVTQLSKKKNEPNTSLRIMAQTTSTGHVTMA